mgnify:CR=1 FL=1
MECIINLFTILYNYIKNLIDIANKKQKVDNNKKKEDYVIIDIKGEESTHLL